MADIRLVASDRPSTKIKTSGIFRIPGLGNDPVVQKSGISATSSARVITFLPTPLLVDDSQKKNDPKVKPSDQIQQFSSPTSSPVSKFSFNANDEVDEFPERPSSPPTSDPIHHDDDDIVLRWNPGEVRKRYADIPRKVAEVCFFARDQSF